MRVVVGHRDLAAPDAPGELGALLDDQRVRGDVVGSRADRGVEAGPPVVVGLAGGAVDQVEVDVVEARRARLGDARLRAAGGVRAVEDLQDVPLGALHPEGDPVEAAFAQGFEVGRADRLGVGLGGDLGVVREPELVPDRGQHPHEVGGGQQGRGAAADEDGADRARVVAEDLAGPADLLDQVGGVVVAGGQRPAGAAQLGGGVGVEVAVAAAGGAVRDVQVEAERAVGCAFQGVAGQRPVVGHGFTIGQYGRHTVHCRSPPTCFSPRAGPAAPRRRPGAARRTRGRPAAAVRRWRRRAVRRSLPGPGRARPRRRTSAGPSAARSPRR